MIVTTDGGKARLVDAEDLKAFKLVHSGERDTAAVARALSQSGAGRVEGEVAWIDVTWLVLESGDRNPDWKRGFAAMVAFANARGWYDELTAAVRSHIEWDDR